MVITILILLGLALGSFTNALVWRIHEQSKRGKKRSNNKLSILTGRSMCTHCSHQLSAVDLIPVISWTALRGKCRYCRQAISWQYPLVELATVALFLISYIYWPYDLALASSVFLFVLWLVFLVGFMALVVYDLRWYLLPDRVVYPMIVLVLAQTLVVAVFFNGGWQMLLNAFLAVLASAGVFYAIYTFSAGKWIGGGDVKLAVVLGLLLGTAPLALLMIFVSSVLGTAVAVPLLAGGKANRTSHIPYGPFLILATIICYLFGKSILAWYQMSFI